MACCLRIGSSEDVKPAAVKKRFIFMYEIDGKLIGFTPIGPPHYINEPITKRFKGIAGTYFCTASGSVYSTNKLEVFEKEG